MLFRIRSAAHRTELDIAGVLAGFGVRPAMANGQAVQSVLTPKQDRVAEALRPNGPNLVAEIEPVKPAAGAN